MAVQAQIYPENLGLMMPMDGTGGGGGCGGGVVGSSQDWFLGMETGCISSSGLNQFSSSLGCGGGGGLSQKQQLQQQFILQQQQQQNQQQAYLQLQLQQQQQNLLQQHNQQQQNQKMNQSQSQSQSPPGFVFSATSTTNNSGTTTINDNSNNLYSFSSAIDAQLAKQNEEISRFLNAQNERLKLALQQQRKQQFGSLFRKFEAKAALLLRQKDEEISKATKRTLELEEFARRIESENQLWQKVVFESEATVISLNNTLQQLKEKSQFSNNHQLEAEDAQSCCDDAGFGSRNEEDEVQQENGGETEDNRARKKMKANNNMACKVCSTGNLCVLFLPCRHLCSCKACEPLVDCCPVCKSEKKGAIEALIS